jgi:hypothetical protein
VSSFRSTQFPLQLVSPVRQDPAEEPELPPEPVVGITVMVGMGVGVGVSPFGLIQLGREDIQPENTG